MLQIISGEEIYLPPIRLWLALCLLIYSWWLIIYISLIDHIRSHILVQLCVVPSVRLSIHVFFCYTIPPGTSKEAEDCYCCQQRGMVLWVCGMQTKCTYACTHDLARVGGISLGFAPVMQPMWCKIFSRSTIYRI